MPRIKFDLALAFIKGGGGRASNRFIDICLRSDRPLLDIKKLLCMSFPFLSFRDGWKERSFFLRDNFLFFPFPPNGVSDLRNNRLPCVIFFFCCDGSSEFVQGWTISGKEKQTMDKLSSKRLNLVGNSLFRWNFIPI